MCFACSGKAEAGSVVDGSAGPADGETVSLGDEIVDVDVDLTEGALELPIDGFEAFRASEDGVGFGKAVAFSLWVEEFVDGGFAALIPDFIKPAFCEGLVLFGHNDTSCARD